MRREKNNKTKKLAKIDIFLKYFYENYTERRMKVHFKMFYVIKSRNSRPLNTFVAFGGRLPSEATAKTCSKQFYNRNVEPNWLESDSNTQLHFQLTKKMPITIKTRISTRAPCMKKYFLINKTDRSQQQTC